MINPSNTSIFWGSVCFTRRLTVRLVLSLALLVVARVGVTEELVALYHIGAVKVAVPLKANRNARAKGLRIAKKVAFESLLPRMLTQADRNTHKDFLDALRRDAKRFVERAAVVSEIRRSRSLFLTIDVTFSQKKIRAALAQKGILYNETLHPPVLFLVQDKDRAADGATHPSRSKFERPLQKILLKSAKALGLSVVMPLGDMEDLMHLSWERAAAGDASLRQWALTRYLTREVWAVSVALQRLTKAGKRGVANYAATAQRMGDALKSTEQSPSPSHQVEIQRAYPSDAHPGCKRGKGKNPRTCLYPDLILALLQKMMDQWIQEHAVNPSLYHSISLRVIHGPVRSKFAKFIKKLRAVPGLVALTFLEGDARTSRLQVAFQGRNEQLRDAIIRMGAQIGHNSVSNPSDNTVGLPDTTQSTTSLSDGTHPSDSARQPATTDPSDGTHPSDSARQPVDQLANTPDFVGPFRPEIVIYLP